MLIDTKPSKFLRNILTIVFVLQINDAYKRGIFRQYRTFKKNDSKFKGIIDIERHIKLNPIFNGSIAYSTREYTIDNDVNRLIFTAYEVLEKKNKLLLNELMKDKKNVSEYFVQLDNIMKPFSRQESYAVIARQKKIIHPFYQGWDEVRKTAIQILRFMGFQGSEKKQNQAYGILIYMPTLWERYIQSILENCSDIFKTQYHRKSKDILIEKDEDRKEDVRFRNCEPDFCLIKKGKSKLSNPTAVFDAKYKKRWFKVSGGKEELVLDGDLRADVYQIISYMHIFPVKIGGIICPGSDECHTKKYRLFKDLENESFYLLSLGIPKNCSTAAEFIEKMNENEMSFCDNIKNIFLAGQT